MNLLLLATDLAMLTYALGVLILALPVPYRPLKSWGPRLIGDSLAAGVLISMTTIIISLGDLLLTEIGADWNSFYLWLSGLTAALTSAFTGLLYAATLVKSSAYSFLASPLNIVASYISTAFSSIKLIYLLSAFIYSSREKLVTLGVLLYSLPFRLGKGVGGFLIAASIIFYVGFPLMPVFVSTFQSVSVRAPQNYENPTIYIHVEDLLGHSLPYPIVYFYTNPTEKEPVGVIIGDSNGDLVIGDSLDTLPRNFTLFTLVGFSGAYIKPTPDRIEQSSGNVTLTASPVIYSNGIAVYLPVGCLVSNAFVNSTLIDISINLKKSSSMLITAVKGVKTSYVLINGSEIKCLWNEEDWNSINIRTCKISLNAGSEKLIIKFKGIPYPKPSVPVKRIVFLDTVMDIVTGLLTAAISFLYIAVFLPGIYLALLISITAALSRVLGGSRFRLI